MYTPRWTRGSRTTREGWCSSCGSWHKLKVSSTQEETWKEKRATRSWDVARRERGEGDNSRLAIKESKSLPWKLFLVTRCLSLLHVAKCYIEVHLLTPLILTPHYSVSTSLLSPIDRSSSNHELHIFRHLEFCLQLPPASFSRSVVRHWPKISATKFNERSHPKQEIQENRRSLWQLQRMDLDLGWEKKAILGELVASLSYLSIESW